MNSSRQVPRNPLPGKPNVRWGQDQRLAFIDFRLQWDGRINRSDLTQFFGISIPQASLDLTRYQELAPQNLTYDRRSRAYLVTEGFLPINAENQPRRYLDELLALETSILEEKASFVGWRPPVGVASRPVRAVEAATLIVLLQAIKEVVSIVILYQSMSSLEPGERTISPHALGYDGFRWHVRACCHKREDYRDFVLGRILDVKKGEALGVSAAADTQWNKELTLILAPNPDLAEAQRRVIELDYGMKGGEISIRCRQALLYYTLRQLGLDDESRHTPERQQIVLKNRKELAPFLQGL
jgi:predicted DNA-binding transcriptional regulator YafY